MSKHVLAAKKRWAVVAAALVAGVALSAPDIAFATDVPRIFLSDGVKTDPYSSATAFVTDLVAWSAQNSSNFVACTVVSSQAVRNNAGSVPAAVGYSTVLLSPSGTGSIYGTGSQLFNDRRTGTQPFNVAQADTLGVRLTGGTGVAPTVTLTALSWGGAQQTLSGLRMEDGVLVGDGQSVGNQVPSALYTLSCSTFALS
jgi:hypothetical protein